MTMATIKLFGGDLDDITAFFRCDLSQASSPLHQWNEEEECWVSTQYQCADCRHDASDMATICKSLAAEWAEMAASEFFCEWEEVSGVDSDADLSHEDARGWYSDLG